VWQTQHRLCVCVLVSLCKMCFTKWSLKYSETRNRAAKERSTNNSMFRCDRCLQNRKDEDEDVLRVSFASSANVCVCVWLFVFGGSKKDSKLALKRTSLFVFNATRSFEYVPPALVYIDDAVTRAREKR